MSEHEGIRKRARSATRAEEIQAVEQKARKTSQINRHTLYGIRVDPIQWFYILSGQDEAGSEHPSIVLIIYSVIPVVFVPSHRKGSCCKIVLEIIPTGPGMVIHIINLLVLILLPMVIIHVKDGFSLVGASGCYYNI
ncbi:hypothetical protein NQ318_008052 [Aromia moschata]|uniref:Uncharacterized protein n=1 Tax=Aromia moschata TaxID=1265417 RepID=A0AAV8XD13_9CUCU|nr:hypothetical protein NQ318_008052 [Aromia moschata]